MAKHHPFFIRLFNWEYWSFGMVYTWIYPVWIFLCLRARSFFFFSAANPSIRNGGFLNESKKEIHDLIPADLCPATAFFSLPANADHVVQQLAQSKLYFPMIGKPDVGGRGRGVKALRDEEEVRAYVQKAFLDFHIQEFVPYKNEVGIFYYRYPGETRGCISGIVRKEFLSVTGDGKKTMRELLNEDPRAVLQLKVLETTYGKKLDVILPPNDQQVVVPYGNHARGAKFLDDSHLVDETLTNMIDDVCKRIPDFYFGRLDIRYQSWDELKQGKNYSIIEVNGAGSEPTHIYDPKHSIFFAWKEIIRHWKILCRISMMNHKQGHKYLTIKEGIQMFREDKIHSERLAAMDEK
jgi:hypothetical protein